MNLNMLGISVGNTRTRIGVFVEGKLAERFLLTNGDWGAMAATLDMAWQQVRDSDDPRVLIATVNPPVSDRIVKDALASLGVEVLRCERDVNIPIGRQLDRESIVGEDRLLNAAAAYETLKQACVVVDTGTAITVDFVDGVGTFHGGAIAPGLRMMLSAMQQGTAQLPEIELARPEEPIGHNTAEAMRSGVYHAARGLVHELTEKYAEIAGGFPPVIVTGGDAELLFEGDERIDRIVPDLTLLGLAATMKKALSDEA